MEEYNWRRNMMMEDILEPLNSWRDRWNSISNYFLFDSSVHVVCESVNGERTNDISSMWIFSPLYRIHETYPIVSNEEIIIKFNEFQPVLSGESIKIVDLLDENGYKDWREADIISGPNTHLNFFRYNPSGLQWYLMVTPPSNNHVEKNMPRYDNLIKLVIKEYTKYQIDMMKAINHLNQEYKEIIESLESFFETALAEIEREYIPKNDYTGLNNLF